MEVKDCKVQLQGTIYIDSVFVLNLVMDLYLLTLLLKVLGKTATYTRIFAGSIVGAAGYCIVLCIPGISYMLKVLLGMIPIGILMIKITCGVKGKKELLRATGYLFLFSFLLGGFIIFLNGIIPFFAQNRDSLTVIAGLGFICFAILQKGITSYQKKLHHHFCTVYLKGNTGKIEITALIDTGNGLIEPVSGNPVAILEEGVWEKLTGCMKPEKFKVIPYYSLGKSGGMLEGYEIDSMIVKGKNGEKQFDKVVIAIFKGKVSGKGGYQMILPPELSI